MEKIKLVVTEKKSLNIERSQIKWNVLEHLNCHESYTSIETKIFVIEYFSANKHNGDFGWRNQTFSFGET